jgi:hypothetical protein
MELNQVRNLRLPAFILAGILTGVSAVFAQTQIHELGHAPLLGTSSSTAEIRHKVAEHPELIREAAREIGLSPAEYHAFLDKFNSDKPYWGNVPRHLDAMSWSANNHVYVIHDVVIPSGVNGWEVDLREKHQLVKLYIPMICGNLSVVRVPIHEVAARPPLPVAYVAPPAPVPVPLVAAAAPPPAQQIPPVAPAAVMHHPHLFWPIFAVAVAGIIIATDHHNHNSSTPNTTPVGGGAISQPSTGGGGSITITPSQPSGGYHCGCGQW